MTPDKCTCPTCGQEWTPGAMPGTPRPEDGFLTAAREVVESFEMAENVTRQQNNALGKLAGFIALADKHSAAPSASSEEKT